MITVSIENSCEVLIGFDFLLLNIATTTFSGGRNRRSPPTMGKQLMNFITCGCESSAPFL
jgi:hypothetical protein